MSIITSPKHGGQLDAMAPIERVHKIKRLGKDVRPFLAELMRHAPSNVYPWIARFPNFAAPDWSGQLHCSNDPLRIGDVSAFYSTSLFPLDATARANEQAAGAACALCDDVGTKVHAEDVRRVLREPSFRIETSSRNEQWGYLFTRLATVDEIDEINKLLVARKLSDSNGMSAVRYARLPAGINNKPEYGARVFRVRMLESIFDRRYDPGELLERLRSEPVESSGSEESDVRSGDKFDLAAALRDIRTGNSLHDPINRTAAHFAAVGVPETVAVRIIQAEMELSEENGTRRWRQRFDDVDRSVRSGYAKFVAEWREPTPLVRPLPPAEPYPAEALGPVLGPAARALTDIVQVPYALAGNSVLATATLAAQAHADVETLGGIRPLSQYILTVAMSGDRKTKCDEVALAPVDRHLKEKVAVYNAALLKGVDPPPREPWIICTEPTAEGLFRALYRAQYGQGIYSDEGGQFIGGHAMSEEAELRSIAMLSRAWQGLPLDRVRAMGDERTVLYNRRLSMHLMVQPEVAARMLGRALYRSQGYLSRWLIVAPHSLAGTRFYDVTRPDPKDDERIREYDRAVATLLARPVKEDRKLGGLSLQCLKLGPESRALLVPVYDDIERKQGAGEDLQDVREWASKAAEHACRIAGVLTLIQNPDAKFVSPAAMKGALELVSHYLGEYRRLVGCAGASLEIIRAQTLLNWLRQKGRRSVTPRHVAQYGPNSIRTADDVRATLRLLTNHGWTRSTDGRTWEVNPAAFTAEVP